MWRRFQREKDRPGRVDCPLGREQTLGATGLISAIRTAGPGTGEEILHRLGLIVLSIAQKLPPC